MTFFDINTIAFEVIGYPVSYVELIGTLFGLISVYFASRANILTWPTGIINEFFLFILFFQVQLYADMFLQVYFFDALQVHIYQHKAEKPMCALVFMSIAFNQSPRIFFYICW